MNAICALLCNKAKRKASRPQQFAVNKSIVTKQRESGMELFRILVMLAIVMHHYIINSPFMESIMQDPLTMKSIGSSVFGMWGKVGINCFVMITGWYMCTSRITKRKYAKLLGEVMFYKVVITVVYVALGMCTLSFGLWRDLLPVTVVGSEFVSAYLVFYLLIPFLNILIHNMGKRQHALLLLLLLGVYSLLGTGVIGVTVNYVTWFSVLYLLMAYMRLHGLPFNISHRQWGWLSVAMMALAILLTWLVAWLSAYGGKNLEPWFFVADCNKCFSWLVALCCFMWFKGLDISYRSWINTIASTTFGVLLIHANRIPCNRDWCEELFKRDEAFLSPYWWLWGFASCVMMFSACSVIDYLRIRYVERPYLKLYDRISKDANVSNG